jgi:hypothetical protein
MPTPRVSGILTLIGRIPGGAVQLSELLGLDVVDATAQRVGTVVDVRLAAEGDLDDGPALQDCSAWWSARERD